MNKFIILSFVLSSYLISSVICADETKCKDFKVEGCKCYEPQIYCTGVVKAEDLAKLPEWLKSKTSNFDYLHIYGSKLTTLDSSIFGYFKNIFIEENEDLKDMTLGTPVTTVKPIVISIRNNIKFEGKELNKILEAYKADLVTLELNNNNIATLPVINNFVKLEVILLNNQNVAAVVPENFLNKVPELRELSLAGNKITSLKANAIDLSDINSAKKISIFLDNNDLKDESLVKTNIKIGKASIGLDLEKNKTPLDLEKCIDLFSDIAANNGHVYLDSSVKNTCDCDKLKEKLKAVNIKTNVWGLKCKQGTKLDVELKDCNTSP